LSPDDWQGRRDAHHLRFDRLLAGPLAKRAEHGRHSIEEFLFTYYSYRPAQLRRWQPGLGLALQGATTEEFGASYVADRQAGVRLDAGAVVARRRASITWIHALLTGTASRPPHFGCFGMHEWAMVYRQSAEEVRHSGLPLRLGPAATAEVVDANRVRCSHFDAFRFFTPPARSLNVLQPTREAQSRNEQPGCLHANMDVYRWAHKLSPLTSSELVMDCFELAREIRTLDMRASPYDVSPIGLESLLVENPEGRSEYVRQQQQFAASAAPLRGALIQVCETALRGT
jgi:hypothetical protein